MPPRTRRPKKSVKPTPKPSATPSPPPDPDLVTPQVPESRGIRVFTEQETLYFSSSSKASASKLDPILPGEGPVKLSNLPKAAGSMRSKIALRGADGVGMSQALDQTTRMEAFMRSQAEYNAATDSRLNQMTAAAIENSESVVMVSLMNLLLGAFTGTLPTPRFVDNDNHQTKKELRLIFSQARSNDTYKSFWKKKFKHPLNKSAMDTFLQGVDIKKRHLDSHLETSRIRLFSNILVLEDYRYKGEEWDNAYSIGLKLLCVVLHRYGETAGFIATINDPTSVYPKIPSAQLERVKKYI